MQIGIIADLDTSQLSYLIAMQVTTYDSVALFIKNYTPPISRIPTAIFNIAEIVHFKGILIATDLDSARYLTKLCTSARKIYYPWHIEWKRHGVDYLDTVRILTDPTIEIVARSPDHANYIALWNRQVDAIIEDLNLGDFIKLTEMKPQPRCFVNEKYKRLNTSAA